MGVLPRYGFCYFICAALVIYLMDFEYEKRMIGKSKLRNLFVDIEVNWLGWIIILLFLLLHSILTFCLEVPGCPT